ncbi:MAG: FeoB-associated Cys-rich membrane protein [Oscillospiraceae bacterium]
MLNLIIANLATILVGAAVVGVIAAVIGVMHHDKKLGKSSCGCACADCPNKGACGH